MYWFLVMRADLGIARGDLAALKGRRIGAAPWVEMGLRRLLTAAGLDPARERDRYRPGAGRDRGDDQFRADRGARRWPTARSTGSGPTAWRPRSR